MLKPFSVLNEVRPMPELTLAKRPDLALSHVRETVPCRLHPYWSLLEFSRHVGYQKRASQPAYWMARFRTKAGKYKQCMLGKADQENAGGLSHQDAIKLAYEWFRRPENSRLAADAYPPGPRQDLIICPCGPVFSVGHALHDYVEWKRIAAAPTHFETTLSLVNHHIIPRLAEVPLANFTGLHLRDFARAVLETPPKRGNQRVGPRRAISELDEEALRKRKKTLNSLIGILRMAFQMAWENGRIESDRAWRCLRRVPNVERPRTLFLSRAECSELLLRCRPDLRWLVLGALYTGCRATELLRLTVADVAREGYGVYVAPVKTYRPRFVFLPDEGMMFFLSLCRGHDPREPVFKRESGWPWLGNHKHLFKAAVRAAGLPQGFTFHGLRHTYASQLVQAGTPLSVIAEQLGHANTTTVSRTYGHLAPQIREAEVRQRFSPLDPEISVAALRDSSAALSQLRSRLHGRGWRSYAAITDTSSWPRANFFRGDAELVQICRPGVRPAGK